MQHGQSAPPGSAKLGSCASSGHAWRLWLARHSPREGPGHWEHSASASGAHFTASDHTGLASEFPGDTLVAGAADAAAIGDAAALELINELGATNPCVNGYIDFYPEPVPPTTLDAAGLGATLERGAARVGQPIEP